MTAARRQVRAPSAVALALCALALCLAGCGSDDDGLPAPPGLYAFDRAAYARAVLEEGLGQGSARTPPTDVAARAEALDRANREAARVDMQLVLEADGTFVVRYQFDKERGSYGGTWKRHGERLTFVTTQTLNGRLPAPEVVEARYTAEGVHFPPGSVPRPFLLRRR